MAAPIPTISGTCAFYVIPDYGSKASTYEKARRFTGALTQGMRTVSYVNTEPHVVLYRANFDRAPVPEIEKVLDDVAACLGSVINLDPMLDRPRPGHRELAWQVKRDRSFANGGLMKAHIASLALAKYLDKAWHATRIHRHQARKQPLPKRQMANIIDYGVHWVRDEYEPYLLLAKADLGERFGDASNVKAHQGFAVAVGFAELGPNDTLANIVALRT